MVKTPITPLLIFSSIFSDSLSSVTPGDVTPCNFSPSLPPLLAAFRPLTNSNAELAWKAHIQTLMNDCSPIVAVRTFQHFNKMFKVTKY